MGTCPPLQPGDVAHPMGSCGRSGLLHLPCRNGTSSEETSPSGGALGQHLGTGFLENTGENIPGGRRERKAWVLVKETPFPVVFFPRRVTGGGWKGHPGLLQVADEDGVNWCQYLFIYLFCLWLGLAGQLQSCISSWCCQSVESAGKRPKAIKIAPSSLSGLLRGSSSFLPLGSTEHEGLATPAGAPEAAVKTSPRLTRISKNRASPACSWGLRKLLLLRAGGG